MWDLRRLRKLALVRRDGYACTGPATAGASAAPVVGDVEFRSGSLLITSLHREAFLNSDAR